MKRNNEQANIGDRKQEERESTDGAWRYDASMKVGEQAGPGLQWHSPMEAPFRLAGFPWLHADRRYRRLPVRPDWPLPEAVDRLADCTAGGQIQFVTNASALAIRVRLSGPADMYHMPATGQCGFDCYIGPPGEQQYFATVKYDLRQSDYECLLFDKGERDDKVITLNFPLYQGVQEVMIGLPPGASVSPPPAYADDRKIVIYGTSITQGGCASRPGMAYPSLVSRRLNREVVNLGFSGNGKGEPELARIIAQIEDPACLVLDYEANVDTAALERTLPPFIEIYREKHPEVPILVVSRITHAKEKFEEQMRKDRAERKEIQRQAVAWRHSRGDGHIYFVDGSRLLGDFAQDCTVDGSHPTDWGFHLMAEGLTPVIHRALASRDAGF